MESTNFTNLELISSKPTSVEMETIQVEISEMNLFGDFAHAFVAEATRVSPLTMDKVNLTEAEMRKYIDYLTYQRIQCVKGECNDYRKIKLLFIPSWIQYNLSMIGRVIIREVGLNLEPIMEKPDQMLTYQEAVLISDKISAFEGSLQMVQDAMPRSPYGDRDVMSTALVAGYVRSLAPVEHVASTYVTAFMGMKLKEEQAMKVLYRIQYDDYEFIRSAITLQKGLY